MHKAIFVFIEIPIPSEYHLWLLLEFYPTSLVLSMFLLYVRHYHMQKDLFPKYGQLDLLPPVSWDRSLIIWLEDLGSGKTENNYEKKV